jgi:hypothetical protein
MAHSSLQVMNFASLNIDAEPTPEPAKEVPASTKSVTFQTSSPGGGVAPSPGGNDSYASDFDEDLSNVSGGNLSGSMSRRAAEPAKEKEKDKAEAKGNVMSFADLQSVAGDVSPPMSPKTQPAAPPPPPVVEAAAAPAAIVVEAARGPTREMGTQCMGNDAGVQADLAPPSMYVRGVGWEIFGRGAHLLFSCAGTAPAPAWTRASPSRWRRGASGAGSGPASSGRRA